MLELLRTLLGISAAETEEDEDEDDDEDQTNRNLVDDYTPHVLILSSGDITPFELRIVRQPDRAEITMTMSLLGEFEIQANDQQSYEPCSRGYAD